MRTRDAMEESELAVLEPYATMSRGAKREHPEPESNFRTHFQRDWNRVIHSRAFRKLEYKTQVMPFGMGSDISRNRLTHTLEAIQVGLAMARILGLNEDLVMGIVMAHDLGHPPFGHDGEVALNELCDGHFNHNVHSLRIVRELENRYTHFEGLNLTLDLLEGLEKHHTDYDQVGSYIFNPGLAPSLEAQVSNLADTIAYRAHDIEDALESGILAESDFEELHLWQQVLVNIHSADELSEEPPRRQALISRYAIDLMIRDVVETTSTALESEQIRTREDVQNHPDQIVSFSPAMKALQTELGDFLYNRLYRHPRVVRATSKGKLIIRHLFARYCSEPAVLPLEVQNRLAAHGTGGDGAINTLEDRLVVADFIAGMTDRFAMREHDSHFGTDYSSGYVEALQM